MPQVQRLPLPTTKRGFWLSLLSFVVCAASAHPQPSEPTTESFRGAIVRSIELSMQSEGLAVPNEARELVELTIGRGYSPLAVRRSIKQLFALAQFSDIKVEASRLSDGVGIRFLLYPLPTLAGVRLEGIDRSPVSLRGMRDELIDATGLAAGDLFDTDALEPASKRLVDLLGDEGYLWAAVDPEARFSSPTAEIVFHVVPGPLALVDQTTTLNAPPHYTLRFLREQLDIEQNTTYVPRRVQARVDSMVQQWRRRGFYNAEIQIQHRLNPPRHVGVDIDVRIGPKVLVDVEGVDLSDGRKRELIPIFNEMAVTEDLIEESRVNLLEDFRERGHLEAQVSALDETQREGRYRSIIFQVEPGKRFEVASIELQGASSLGYEELSELLVTEPSRRFRASPFRSGVWEQDLRELEHLLKRRGYHRARVESLRRELPEEPGRLVLTIEINEGPRAVIESLRVDGTVALSPLDVSQAALLDVGEPFDASAVVRARDHIVNLYRNEGFQQAVVVANTLMNSELTGASVLFEIREGVRTRIDQIIIGGLDATRESTVRNLIALRAEGPLSSADLLETRQRLVGTGLFREVSVQALPADPQTGASDVLVNVREGPRTSIGYGFGYEERELARASVEVTRRNLFGLNRTVSLFTRGSLRGSRFITTYRQPDTFGLKMPFFLSGFREEEDRTGFDFIRLGLGLQVSKKLSPSQTLFFRYNFARTRVFRLEVEVDEIDRQFRNILLSTVSASTVVDTRDDPINPTRGQFRILDVEVSSKFLGTRSPYLRGLAQQFLYFPLPKRLVGAIGMRLGMAQSFREDRDALIPITERFFAGGANTLRGFGLDEASPKDVTGDPIGGNVLALVNLELRFPIIGSVGGVVFSDNGTVYRRLQVIELLGWRYNMGFGVRVQTPLGPIRVDYGFKLDRREGESRGRWHVSLGHAF